MSTLIIAVLTGSTSVLMAQAEKPSARHLLVRMATEPQDVQTLYDSGLDVWDVAPDGGSVDVRVSSGEIDDLRQAGFVATVLDADVYATIQSNVASIATGTAPWTAYHTLDSATEFMFDLAEEFPERVSVRVIGESIEQRPIYALRIGQDLAIDNDRAGFLVVGCHHAREWISVEVPLYLAERLAVGYQTDTRVRRLLDAGDVWIVPILNPDGFLYSQTTDRLWRLNRHRFAEAVGVDLNRNYGYQWGRSIGSSAQAGAETYRGTASFSEPETRAVRDLLDAHRITGVLSFHSFGQVVLAPWAYTFAQPPDGPEMLELAAEIADVMNAERANPADEYRSGPWASALYVASGVLEDWAYGVHGIMASLIELPPRTAPYFLLPPEAILPTAIEAYAGALHMIERVFGVHEGAPGDFDGSGEVEWADARRITSCMAGPGGPPPGFPLGCNGADIARDSHVDLRDLATFQNRFGRGPGRWPHGPDDSAYP